MRMGGFELKLEKRSALTGWQAAAISIFAILVALLLFSLIFLQAGVNPLIGYQEIFSYAFANPFGVQTLGVSARFQLRGDASNWQRHRVLLSMYNAEVYLRPRHFFTVANMAFLARRWRGLAAQLRTRLDYMARGR